MPCCRFGIQALAERFDEIDAAAPFMVAVVVVMVVSLAYNDGIEWWQREAARSAATTQSRTAPIPERLVNPVGRIDTSGYRD